MPQLPGTVSQKRIRDLSVKSYIKSWFRFYKVMENDFKVFSVI